MINSRVTAAASIHTMKEKALTLKRKPTHDGSGRDGQALFQPRVLGFRRAFRPTAELTSRKVLFVEQAHHYDDSMGKDAD